MDKIQNLLHVALPYLSYVVNMFNRLLSLMSSFVGIELLPEGGTADAEETTTEIDFI